MQRTLKKLPRTGNTIVLVNKPLLSDVAVAVAVVVSSARVQSINNHVNFLISAVFKISKFCDIRFWRQRRSSTATSLLKSGGLGPKNLEVAYMKGKRPFRSYRLPNFYKRKLKREDTARSRKFASR